MFTGLIEGKGLIKERKRISRDIQLTIEPEFDWQSPLVMGESIAVSGVCLTVTKILNKGAFEAYVSDESIKHSNLSEIKEVNLERALRPIDRLGGHLVTGHSDGLAILSEKKYAGKSLSLVFRISQELRRYLAPKGSVALDGVSLTINSVTTTSLSVNIIPATLEATTLKDLKIGDKLNIECDILAKYLESLILGKKNPPLSMEKLMEEGF
jgi:riboflavin synthase